MCHVPFPGQSVKVTWVVRIVAVGARGIPVDHWSTVSSYLCNILQYWTTLQRHLTVFWNTFSRQKLFVLTEWYFQANWHMVKEMVWPNRWHAITWTNADPDLSRFVTSQCHNYLKIILTPLWRGPGHKYQNSNGVYQTIICVASKFLSTTSNDYFILIRYSENSRPPEYEIIDLIG